VAVIASIILAAVVAWSALMVAREIRIARVEARRSRALAILAWLGPGVDAAERDPRAILLWQPLAGTARVLFPDEFADLDRAAGGTFPFDTDRLQAAHGRWTADWLAWERAHDAEYRRRAAAAEEELVAAQGTPQGVAARGRLDAIEREKLELYQRRYEEYVRVAKALQALGDSVSARANEAGAAGDRAGR
jgi:hypothetical protein